MSKKFSNPVITCGVYLYNTLTSKILICHPTRATKQTWTIPKGLKHRNENIYQAAIRELHEETGINIKNINILKQYKLAKVNYKNKRKILASILIITDTDLSNVNFSCSSLVKKQYPEIDDWKWKTIKSAEKYLHESQKKNITKINGLVLRP